MARVTVCIRRTTEEPVRRDIGAENQTYKDFEVLVCNDWSSDGTQYLDSFVRPMRVHNDQNKNLPPPWPPFQEASGEYIAIHHDHDPTAPEWLGSWWR